MKGVGVRSEISIKVLQVYSNRVRTLSSSSVSMTFSMTFRGFHDLRNLAVTFECFKTILV